jgi:two-component system chemotaxis response regulator CheY
MVSVLVVDDSLFIRKLLRDIMASGGYETVGEATNGDEAVELYKKLCPDIVLLDIVMQAGENAKTGIDALRQIMTSYPSANVVICSALDQQKVIAEALRLGARAFLAKPIKPEELLEVLSVCIDLDVLRELGTIGAGHATTALSEVVEERITVEVPSVQSGPPHLVPRVYGRHDQPTTVIHMELRGKADCDIMLAFEADEAAKIAELMTSSLSLDHGLGLEKSAIEELGSIMICSFLSVMADFAGFHLIPMPPETITDSFDAIIDGFLARQAMVSNAALIFETRFRRSSSSAAGFLMVFPTLEFQKLLIEGGKKLFASNTKTVVPSKLKNVYSVRS